METKLDQLGAIDGDLAAIRGQQDGGRRTRRRTRCWEHGHISPAVDQEVAASGAIPDGKGSCDIR